MDALLLLSRSGISKVLCFYMRDFRDPVLNIYYYKAPDTGIPSWNPRNIPNEYVRILRGRGGIFLSSVRPSCFGLPCPIYPPVISGYPFTKSAASLRRPELQTCHQPSPRSARTLSSGAPSPSPSRLRYNVNACCPFKKHTKVVLHYLLSRPCGPAQAQLFCERAQNCHQSPLGLIQGRNHRKQTSD